jgi:hypothetical protein
MQAYQEATAEANRRKEMDRRIGLLAMGLQSAVNADPNALAGLDVWAWATRIAESL